MRKTIFPIVLVLVLTACVQGPSSRLSRDNDVSYAFPAEPSRLFHVAANGVDSRTAEEAGNPSTPWRTLERVNNEALEPGDMVLLRCGDTFRGSLEISESGSALHYIRIGAYGNGDNPVICGARPVVDWSEPDQAGIITANLPVEAAAVWFDGVRLSCSRYPATGYATMSSIAGARSFVSSRLPTGSSFAGASVHFKAERWSLDYRRVASVAGSVLTFIDNPNYELKVGWGFFINNHPALIDAPSQWAWINYTLSLRAPGDVSVDGHTVEAAVRNAGIRITNASFVAVENVSVRRFAGQGIEVAGGEGIVVRNCEIADCSGYGIQARTVAARIENCAISSCSVGGLQALGADAIVRNNTVNDIGVLYELGPRGYGGACCTGRGLDVWGASSLISGNALDRIGYIGIAFGGTDCVVENNVISHGCLTIDDGAGIYTWSDSYDAPGSAGTVIRNNLVSDMDGVSEGTPYSDTFANGIYLDDRNHDILVENNTLRECGIGIFLHNGRNHLVRGNVVYDSRDAAIVSQRDSIAGTQEMYGNRVIGNTLFMNSDRPCFKEWVHAPNSQALASYSGNIETNLTLLGLSTTVDGVRVFERNFVDLNTVPVLRTVLAENFEPARPGWYTWPTAQLVADTAALTSYGRAARIASFAGTQAEPLFISPGFSLRAGGTYLLSYSIWGTPGLRVTPNIRLSGAPWTNLSTGAVSTLTETKNERVIAFSMANEVRDACFDLLIPNTDAVVYLDSVRIVEIDAASLEPDLVVECLVSEIGDSVPFTVPRGSSDLEGHPVSGTLRVAPYSAVVIVRPSP